jgi:hypothetical protein
MQPLQVFIITPFDRDGQRVQNAVRDAMEEAGFRVVQYITYDPANIHGLADRVKAETRAVAAPSA